MKTTLLAALTLTVLFGTAVTSKSTSPSEKEALQAAHKSFYSALNAMFQGELEPMGAVWSHADDVTYMSPTGGREAGWKKVAANWEAQAKQKLGGKVEAHELRMHVGTEIAVTTCFEKGQNQGADGKPLTVSIRATNTYRKEKGVWKMIGHHTDPLPFLGRTQEARSAR